MRAHHRSVVEILAVLAALVPLCPGQEPQQRPEAIRVQTTLVNVPAIVTDSRGRYIPDLKAAEFTLYEEGQRQPIAVFATSQDPIHVALLLDTSKSTATVLRKIKKAASSFISNLRPQDRAMVVGFDAEVRTLSRLKNDREVLMEDIHNAELAMYPNTRLRDAVFDVVQRELRPVQGRKAIVVLSDGQDVGSAVSTEKLMEAVSGSDIVIYPVHYRVDPEQLMKKLFGISTPRRSGTAEAQWQEYEKQGLEFLGGLADQSAGQLYASEIDDLKKTFAKVTEELRNQYLLGFYPERARLDDRLHGLTVEVGRAGAVVRARRSYRAAAPSAP